MCRIYSFRFLQNLFLRVGLFQLLRFSDFPELIVDEISEQLNAFTFDALNQRFGPLLWPVFGFENLAFRNLIQTLKLGFFVQNCLGAGSSTILENLWSEICLNRGESFRPYRPLKFSEPLGLLFPQISNLLNHFLQHVLYRKPIQAWTQIFYFYYRGCLPCLLLCLQSHFLWPF